MKICYWRGGPRESQIMNRSTFAIFCYYFLLFHFSYVMSLSFFVLECRGVSRMHPFLNFNFSPLRDFILPSYAKVQAQAFAISVSLPSVRNHILYDIVVRAFIDDEAQNWIGCLCVEFEGGSLWHEPLYGPWVGWKVIIKIFFLHFDSWVIFSYM